MDSTSTERRGFTRPEILVILAIMAVLAAVMVPVLTGQLGKSDAARVSADLDAIGTAANAFLSDLSRYPGDLEDLSGRPVANAAATDADINATAYPQGVANRWAGPYIEDIITDGDSLRTAFGAYVIDNFSTTVAANGVGYLTVTVRPLAAADFYRVERVIDGDSTLTSETAGRLRFAGGALTYLALPIN